MENPIKMDVLGVPLFFGNTHMVMEEWGLGLFALGICRFHILYIFKRLIKAKFIIGVMDLKTWLGTNFWRKFESGTLPKTNSCPLKTGWLEDVFPIEIPSLKLT